MNGHSPPLCLRPFRGQGKSRRVREQRHGLVECDAVDLDEEVDGVAGVAGVRAVPVMIFDDDLVGQAGDDVIVVGAWLEPVPELFEDWFEPDLAGSADVRLGPGTSAFAGATADVRA